MNSEPIIQIENLTKDFKEVKAVDNLNLTVNRGDVFGFLGPNGAGKSTTIRMLLTLIKPNKGSIKLFGKDLKNHRREILSKTGAIVEKPDFYSYLSAFKNLEILGKLSEKNYERKSIMDVLDLVGLSSRADSKVKTYSHGMKQRLGLAQALIHDPELIILDEPTTGLDPQGMKEIRDLIIYLSREKNKTIFLSSHILYEVELVANRMIIINKGTTRVQGSVDELLDATKLNVNFEVTNREKTLALINSSKWNEYLKSENRSKFNFSIEEEQIPLLNKYLVENEVEVKAIVPTRSLEEYFLSITREAE